MSVKASCARAGKRVIGLNSCDCSGGLQPGLAEIHFGESKGWVKRGERLDK